MNATMQAVSQDRLGGNRETGALIGAARPGEHGPGKVVLQVA
jgi:hypothetical protein